MREKRLFFCLLTAVVLLGAVGDGEPVPADGSAELAEEIKYIALTFDDGPRRSTTQPLLDGLRERGASATFFLVGERIGDNADLVERMKAEGHQVGNHTWSHVRLEGSTAAVVAEEVSKADGALRELLGEGTYWLRPPYGRIEPGQKAAIPVPMVTWSIDSRDWESLDADKVVAAVLAEAQPGSVILMHDIYPTSVEAALRIIDALQEEGYWFVTVEELLALAGVEAQPGTIYRSGNE